MKKIKIKLEMGDEESTLSLNTNKSLIEVIEHIGKIREEETIESFIESQLLSEGGFIYESPDHGETIYRRKIGEPKREQLTGKQKKYLFDMGGSYEVNVKENPIEKPVSQWVCSYCGENTYQTDSDYLIGVDHLQCALGNEKKEKR